jgi:hypothetical protein
MAIWHWVAAQMWKDADEDIAVEVTQEVERQKQKLTMGDAKSGNNDLEE